MKEIWKSTIVSSLYEVSNMGNVRSMVGGKLHYLKPYPRGIDKGYGRYLCVRLNICPKGKDFSVHRLVAESFIPNPDHLPEVNHKNGIKTDNRVENLEWISRLDNQHHAQYVLMRQFGRRINVRKYSKKGVFICSYNSIAEAAIDNNIDASSLTEVCKGNRKSAGGYIWRYAEDTANVEEFVDARDKPVIQISKYGEAIKTYKSAKEAARENNISCSSNIAGCCRKRRGFNYAGGYMWRYAEDYKNEFEKFLDKTFVCATMAGIFVKEYHGTHELVDARHDLKKVLDCINGKSTMAYHHKWAIKGEKDICREQKRSRAVIQMDMEGNVIKIWNSVKEAAGQFGVAPTALIKKLKKRCRNNIYHGYKWEYK